MSFRKSKGIGIYGAKTKIKITEKFRSQNRIISIKRFKIDGLRSELFYSRLLFENI